MPDIFPNELDGKLPVAFFELPDLRIEASGRSPAVPIPPPKVAPSPAKQADNLVGKPQKTRNYFVPRDLAKRWGVCIDKVLRFIHTGELRAFNVASRESRRPRYRISIEEVRRFEEQTRSAVPPSAIKTPAPRRRKATAAGQKSRTYF
jgi:hypothetical protein